PSVKDFKAIASVPNNMIKLSWQYNELAVKNFVLYRKTEGDKIHVLEVIPGTAREYYDKALKPATQYTYFLVAHFQDWKQSKMSDGVVVKY
ncbi:MAG: fibronectin type III domain-containing protein, partial [Opitutaceae bacterium]|nr:fibronectin type III domain-containing protein [Cytophagales bacterium]